VIVRILGEGQFRVDDAATAELNRLDTELETAVNHNDEPAFTAALDALLAKVRAQGSPLPPDTVGPDPASPGFEHGRGAQAAHGRRPHSGLKAKAYLRVTFSWRSALYG